MDPEDYLKRASKLFQDVGHRVRTTVGIGVGKVELALERTSLAPGDDLRGHVTLRLPEPTEAKRLLLAVRASQQVARVGGRTASQLVETQTLVVWKHHVALDGERVYRDGETFDGELTIPADILDRDIDQVQGKLGEFVRAVSAVRSAQKLPLQWKAMALLHVPWKRNLKSRVDFTVSKR